MAIGLLGPLKIIPASAPRKMVLVTNFSTPTPNEEGHRIDLNIVAPPASEDPVLSYKAVFDDAARVVDIPAGAAMPFAIEFTPALYPEIWRWGVATFPVDFRIRAVSEGGNGPLSAPVTITIDQDDGYFIPNGDWTFGEERDPTAAGGIQGRGRLSLPGSWVVPDGVTLRAYIGPLDYNDPETHEQIHSTTNTVSVTPGTPILGPGSSISDPVNAIMLYVGPRAGEWHPASLQKSFITQGLITVGAPQVTVAPAITSASLGKIDVAQAAGTGTWSGSPTSYTRLWRKNGTPYDPAQTGANYTPVAGDDGADIDCVVTATNAGGSTPYATAPVRISYVAPTVSAPIADQTFDQESGAYESLSLTGVFTGSNLTIEVSGPSVGGVPVVTYSEESNSLSFSLSNAVASTAIEVTASNSGGEISDTFNLVVTASGSALVPTIRGVGGSNTAGNPVFANYKAEDGILAIVRRNASAGFVKPDLAAWSGDKDWVQIFYGTSSGQALGIYLKRCDGNDGADGDLGDWVDGRPTYISVENLDWTDPVGAISTADGLTWQSGDSKLDHPALTPEGANSIIIDAAFCASAITNQAPGLRPDATLIVQSLSNPRKTISRITQAPAVAVAQLDDVNHTVTTQESGVQAVALIELKGAADAAALVWPAAITQSKIVASEITNAGEASSAGYAGQSGHIKVVVAADCPLVATTASGDFELVREYMGFEQPAPPATGNLIDDGTWISSGRKVIGAFAYVRAYWRHIATGVMRVAWSQPPFRIVGLSGGVNTDVLAFAYTKNRGLRYNDGKDTMGGSGSDVDLSSAYYAPVLPYAAYAAMNGGLSGTALTDCYTWVYNEINKTLGPDINPNTNWDPSMQMGYGNQHLNNWMGAVAFAWATPGLRAMWDGSSNNNPAKRARIDILMKCGGMASRGTWREGSDNHFNMLGYANATRNISNPNIGRGPQSCFYAFCWYMGSIAAGDAYLDATDITDLYAILNGYKLANCAKSFSATRLVQTTPNDGAAPSLASVQSRARSQNRWGIAITNPFSILQTDLEFTYDKAITTGFVNSNGTIGFSGRGKFLFDPAGARTQTADGLTASNIYTVAQWDALVARWDAIKNFTTGRCREFQSADTVDLRSSYEYTAMATQVEAVHTLIQIHSGFVTRTQLKNAGLGTLLARAVEYIELAGPYGFGYMQQDKNSSRDWYPQESTGYNFWRRWVVGVRLDLMKQAIREIAAG